MLNGVPRVLIIRLSAIGDVVRVLPALHALRAGLPHAQIDWAVESKSFDVVDGHEDLDRVLVFERAAKGSIATASFWKFCREVRESRYDIVIDFHGILKSGIIARYSGAPDRYGFARGRAREGSYLATNKHMSVQLDALNRVEENLLLAERLAPRIAAAENPGIFVPDDIAHEVDLYFDGTFDGGKQVVAIHVPVERAEKAWPIERYATLSDLLMGDGRFEVVLTWGPGQYDAVHSVRSRCSRNVHVAPESASLKHYAHLVERADLYVGGDTGPMHIAAAAGTPVVALFGGTQPRQHAPVLVPHLILGTPNGAASPSLEALKKLDAETVYDACVGLVFGGEESDEPPPTA